LSNAGWWPDREPVADESEGVQLATMQEFARYWGPDYDWRKCEATLNALPQFPIAPITVARGPRSRLLVIALKKIRRDRGRCELVASANGRPRPS
jgi:hypothetical protein